jgi:hypothetical protein
MSKKDKKSVLEGLLANANMVETAAVSVPDIQLLPTGFSLNRLFLHRGFVSIAALVSFALGFSCDVL